MKLHKSTLAIMVLACVLLATFSVARAELPAPSSFYGQVKINNENVPDGTVVSAWIDGVPYATTNTYTHEGHSVYALDVPGDDPATLDEIEGGQDGDTVVFKIGELELAADQTGTWASETSVNLDLSVMVVTVTAEPQTKVYGEEDPEFTYTYDPQDPEIVFEGDLDRDPGEHVGNYAITPGGLTAIGYTIVFIPDDLTITPKPITVTAQPKSKMYGTIDPPLTFLSSPDLVEGDKWIGGLGRISGEKVGQYAIFQALGIDDGNEGANYTITYQGDYLTIETRPITVTADDQEKVYGELDPPLTYQISSGSLISKDDFTGDLGRMGGEAVGTYLILRGDLAIDDDNGGNNYDLTFIEGTLTITPITITSVAVSDIQTPVAGASPDLLATIAADPAGGVTTPTADVSWEPNDDPFEPAELYLASVTLTAAEGHAFTDSTIATVNGEAANALLNADGTLTVSYEFATAGYNSPPIAEDQTVMTLKGNPVEITLTYADPEGDSLNIFYTKTPEHGVLSGSAPNVLYTPTAGFVGSDYFTFRAYDGHLLSNTATVTIHVVEPGCLQVAPANLSQTQQADIIDQMTLTLTNTCHIEMAFGLMESLIETPVLSEGFEDGLMPPVGWETHQLNETHTWTIVVNPVDQGQSAAWVRWDLDHPSDEWLITPVLDASDVTDLVLSFRAYSSTSYPEASMKVWVLDVDGVPLTDEPLWDMVRDEHWPDLSAYYRSVMVDLGQFDGYEEIRIGWQYVGQGGQSFGLDAIIIGGRADIPWLKLPFTSDSIAAGETKDVPIAFNSTGLEIGTYQGLLSLINFPNPMLNIPVRLRVIGEGNYFYLPLIFR
ncbi:MAG: choice-of-anchor J domain-containing protein [Brevefilum sp.]|nr:choice-of-anchor J domain-containing protein [Brevefilum sp.]